ncbi:hypothetical protein [Cobetia sp. QF-1]|uniref:TackOD1 domain-containing metal-binding protein n=1 Tax=Cobetia sp. QF-1 TaxID=1969833 RepID=UPI0011308D98|nr:hypothetical protein [Cobetia sp. QF-1]
MRIAVVGRAATPPLEIRLEQDSLLRVLCPSSEPSHAQAVSPSFPVLEQFSAIHLFPEEDGPDGLRQLDTLLSAIRATPHGALIPIIVEGAVTAHVQALANQWPGSRAMHLETVIEHREALEASEARDDQVLAPFERLMRWWSLYPEHVLAVSLAAELKAGCHWPLLSAWGIEAAAQRNLLDAFEHRSWIEEKALVTRTRHCRQCRSVHLNYVDVCPRCRHLDLTPLDGLHCFACGHVDRMDRFAQHDQLSCPKCRVRLRHIGVDYDRPLESLACGKCDLWLVEGEVEAHCLDCGQTQQPGELVQQRIASLQLSGEGRRAVAVPDKVGMSTSLPGQRVVPSDLHHMLDLLVPLARRHSHRHLLMVLSHDRDGEHDLLEGMAQRLGSLLRDTDLICEYTAHQWLFLLPHTPRERFEDVALRIQSLTDLKHLDGQLNMSLEMHELPSEHHSGKASQWLPNLLVGPPSSVPESLSVSESA